LLEEGARAVRSMRRLERQLDRRVAKWKWLVFGGVY
jgi:hypothetical protein